jgi:hypothetical protein
MKPQPGYPPPGEGKRRGQEDRSQDPESDRSKFHLFAPFLPAHGAGPGTDFRIVTDGPSLPAGFSFLKAG